MSLLCEVCHIIYKNVIWNSYSQAETLPKLQREHVLSGKEKLSPSKFPIILSTSKFLFTKRQAQKKETLSIGCKIEHKFEMYNPL